MRLYEAAVIFPIVVTSPPGVWAVVAWVTIVITGRKLDLMAPVADYGLIAS